jgi:hypothetical protein
MLTAQRTQERSLSVIRNNQSCKASRFEILFPQAHRNIQMRKFLDSLPAGLRNSTPPQPENFSDATGFKRADSGKPYPFRLPVDCWPPISSDGKNVLQEAAQNIALDLANKRDSILISAITLALGPAKWELDELLPRLSVQKQGMSEVVFLDDKELVRFNEPQLMMATDQKERISYLQSFSVMVDAGK